MWSLSSLRLLHELRLRGTLTAAAEALFLSRSAASHQLATLERTVDAPLTEKVGRGLRLTEVGTELALRAERILQEIELAGAAIERLRGGLSGTVRVGWFQSVAIRLLAQVLTDLREQHPQLRVESIGMAAENALVAVRAGDVDVVIVPSYGGAPLDVPDGLHNELLFHDPVRLAVPADHPAARSRVPVQIADLVDERWIAGAPGSFFGQLVPRLCHQAGFRPDITHHNGDSAIIASLVAAGHGIAFIPASADLGSWPGVAIQEVDAKDAERDVLAVMRASSRHRPTVGTVLQAIRHRCPPA
ncbi:LysR family transcriptional regulator [Actinomadura sp. 9N215]|uniref:LysR family transcriptional regulator n=1 Tax=Actinomadura sp. 9N215 TaxID=3375150 RepID=UPI00379D0770